MDDLLTSVLVLDKEVLHMQHPPLPSGVGEVVDSVANHRGAARRGTCSDTYAHIGGQTVHPVDQVRYEECDWKPAISMQFI